jgi:type IV pilus assembly protein PilB
MDLLKELIKKGILDKEKADNSKEELRASGQNVEDFLIAKRLVSEHDLFSLKAEILKLPLKDVDPKDIKLEVLELVPEETSKYYKMVALSRTDDEVEVGMVYPEQLDAQEALKFLSRRGKFSYKVALIGLGTFNKILKQQRSLKREVGKALEELEEELKTEVPGRTTVAEIERLVEEAPVSKVVAVILKYAVEGGASDIHIEPGKEKLKTRFRLLGSLHSSIFLPIRIHPAIVARIKVLATLKIDENRIPQDGRFSTKVENKDIDFRVSTLPTTLGEKVVIRVLDPATGLKEFEELGLSKDGEAIIQKTIKRPYGLILATGPTGSGKTTTLYAVLQVLNKEGVNIITLEDPVEYFIEGINQSQIRPEINYTFARGLRHILRQDPDIIMVGEIRDAETAELATHAALTGHIVLSTLHTNDSLGVLPRLIDLGVPPFLIPSTVSLAIGQRLVRKLCNDCKKKVKPKPEERDLIRREIKAFPDKLKKEFADIKEKDLFVWEAVGCRKCNSQGFTGRIGIFEVFQMTDRVSDMVLEGVSEKKLVAEAQKQSMATMRQDGISKILRGITTIGEVIRATQETLSEPSK